MATSKLPLKVKVDVRDQFDTQGCEVQKAFAALEEIVGLKFTCDLDWDLLFTTLESDFPDKSTFVPAIASVVIAWCDVLSTRLEDERFAIWIDEIVGRLEAAGSIKLRIQTSSDDRPTTSWSTEQSTFILSFSNTNLFRPEAASSGFETDFQGLCGVQISSVNTSSEALPIRTKSNSSDERSSHDEGWAEIDEVGEAVTTSVNRTRPTASRTISTSITVRPERMPSINTTPSPDLLLKTLTPYMIHVTQLPSRTTVESGSNRIISQGSGGLVGIDFSTQTEQGGSRLLIQGTHEPSLQFLHQYLTRWIKKDRQDTRKVPLLRISLQESHFGLGLTHDALMIEPYDTAQEKRSVNVNVTIVLTIIENILGYRRLPPVASGFWEFQRNNAFR